MNCRICHVNKLSKEYPPSTVSEECDHPSLICLRCVVKHVKQFEECPYAECPEKVTPDCRRIKLFEAILSEMFTEYESTYTPDIQPASDGSVLNITVLNGESIQIPYNPSMTVLDLKTTINLKLNIPVDKQKLLHNDNEIHTLTSTGKSLTLEEYGVKQNATIFLVICLLTISEQLDNVIFDLHWGYPDSNRDHLDASCLAYCNSDLLGIVDFRNKVIKGGSIIHSGDIMDDLQRIGHQIINVHIQKMPASITHLFFVLSAWRAQTIIEFKSPSLKLYEASNKDRDLCNTTLAHAGNSKAVVMCSMSRDCNGFWKIYESGKCSDGFTSNYAPLQTTIQKLINEGF